MLIELTIHTAIPGQLDAFLACFADELRPAAEQAGARLLLLSTGASGRLNEAIVGWSHESATAHAQVQDRLQDNEAWRTARRRAGEALLREHTQLVRTTPFTTVSPAPADVRLLDLRTYSFKPEGLQAYLPLCQADGLPRQREHCGSLLFHGVSASGRLHQLVQAWGYRDQAQYDAGQKNLFKDAEWARGYRQRVIHLVQEQEHQLLRVLPGSPSA
jgi:hypothetical protein